jgi:hypothetical protein
VTAVYLQQSKYYYLKQFLAEVAYLLGRDAGISTVVAFLRGIADSRFHVVALTDSDLKRVAEIS